MDTKYNITRAQANGLYRTIKFMHDTFHKHNIMYWAVGGTLLGAVRHRGIIPWDDDGDLCIFKHDLPKLKKLVPFFNKKGYFLEKVEDDNLSWIVVADKKNALGVDIFIMEQVGPLVTYAEPGWRVDPTGGKKCYFLSRFLYPLTPIRFGNFFIMAPHNPIENLNTCYGTDWNSMGQRLYDHRSGKWIDSKKKRLGIDSYLTIPAPKDTCDDRIPSMPCALTKKPVKNIDKLNAAELRLICSLYKLKCGTSSASRRSAIKRAKIY